MLRSDIGKLHSSYTSRERKCIKKAYNEGEDFEKLSLYVLSLTGNILNIRTVRHWVEQDKIKADQNLRLKAS